MAPNADADTIKKAFRHEIARYHPDKVIHLGPEFQEMAATRAAALTVAYKTLSDPVLRERYDAGVIGVVPPPAPASESRGPVAAPAAAPRPQVPPPVEPDSAPPPPPGTRLFESERASRDEIVRRAITGRVRGVVESLFGPVELSEVRGFDAALVPQAKPRFLGTHPPRVLVKVIEEVAAATVTEAWMAAARSRLHTGKSPLVVLLCGRRLSPVPELLKAITATARHRSGAAGPRDLVIVVANIGDWTCFTAEELPASVRKLVDRICE